VGAQPDPIAGIVVAKLAGARRLISHACRRVSWPRRAVCGSRITAQIRDFAGTPC
jgi:hypothetical protein